MKRSFLLVCVLLLAVFMQAATVSAQFEDEALTFVNVRHLSADAPAVDVYADGELLLEAIEFPQLTGYLELEPGTYEIAIVPTGEAIEAAVIGPAELTFEADHYYQVAAVGSLEAGTLAPLVIDQTAELADFSVGSGEYPQMMAHTIEDGPAVDAYLNGELLVEGLEFGEYAFFGVVPDFEYTFTVTVAGDADTVISEVEGLAFLPEYRVLLAIGTPDDPQIQTSNDTIPYATTIEWLKFYTTNPPGEGASFRNMLLLIEEVGLTEVLSSTDEPYVLVAPVDAAFDGLPQETLDELFADEALLRDIVLYHVMQRDLVRIGAGESRFDMTLQGSTLTFTLPEDTSTGVIINNNLAIITTIRTVNGGINIIGGILVPEFEQPDI